MKVPVNVSPQKRQHSKRSNTLPPLLTNTRLPGTSTPVLGLDLEDTHYFPLNTCTIFSSPSGRPAAASLERRLSSQSPTTRKSMFSETRPQVHHPLGGFSPVMSLELRNGNPIHGLKARQAWVNLHMVRVASFSSSLQESPAYCNIQKKYNIIPTSCQASKPSEGNT